MPRAEIVDRSSVQVLLHNRGRDVRAARDGGRISKLFRDEPHHRCDGSLLLADRFRKTLAFDSFREVDRAEQRAAPRPEVLRGELIAEIDLDVVVEPLAREVVELTLPPVLEDARATPDREQAADRVGKSSSTSSDRTRMPPLEGNESRMRRPRTCT